MTETSLVSVVMPCYNCQSYIEEAIESVLKQSYRAFELIVVDDTSTDASVEIINRYAADNVRLIRHATNQGIARSLNDGIRAARGEFVARMDADDISDPHRLQEQVRLMLNDKELAVVGTGVKVIDQEGNFIYYHINPTEDLQIRQAFASTFPIWSGSQMWRKSKLYESGLFDERVGGIEDLEQALRLCNVGKAGNIKAPLYVYRKNDAGDSNVAHASLVERQILARKIFMLKERNDKDGLERVYRELAAHYKGTRFDKTLKAPLKNKGYYYRGLAFLCRVNDNEKGARTNLDKAKEVDSAAFANWLFSILLKVPAPVVRLVFDLNRWVKKYLYMFYAGNISGHLTAVAKNGHSASAN